MDTTEALKVHEQRKSERTNWENIFDEICYFVLPSQTGFNTDYVQGEKQRWSQRYDSTAVQANATLANHIHMALVSPSSEWFEYGMRDQEFNEIDKVKEWLEDCAKKTYYAINKSNFHGMINTQFRIYCALGIADVEVNFENNDGFKLIFQGGDLSQTTFDIDIHGKIDTKVREFKYSKRHMKELFDMDVKRNETVVTKITRPNPDYQKGSKNIKHRAYIVEWCMKKKKFKEETAYEKPFMAFRFNEAAQEPIYGESPALVCLSDIRTLNEAKRLEMRGYEKAIDPPLIGTANGVVGDLHINSGGYTIVRNPRDIGELPGQMKYEIAMSKGEELRDAILKAFKVDELLVPERKGQNPATAHEIQVRFEQSQKSLGSTSGRVIDELLTDMIKRVFGIMYRNNQFKPMPEELKGQEMDVIFIGPLARSQTSNDAIAIERILQVTPAMMEMYPEVRHIIEGGKAYRRLVSQYAVPADIVRSVSETKKLVKKDEAAAQEQARQENEMSQGMVDEQSAKATSANVTAMENVRAI